MAKRRLIKTFLVARYEFWRYVTRKGFLFVVFGMPLLLAALFGVAIWLLARDASDPVGVVDETGWLLSPAGYDPPRLSAPLLSFADEAAAQRALEAGEVQAFVVVGSDYERSGRVTIYHRDDPFDGITGDIQRYLRASWLARSDASSAASQLLLEGRANVRFIALGEDKAQNEFIGFLFPFVIGILLIMTIFTTAGYMLQAIVDEKENRTMEILITCLSPEELMVGKICGLVGVGLVQTGVWASFILAGFLLLWASFPTLSDYLHPPAITLILVALAWFLPFYLIFAALMTTIGISVTEVSEGQQAAGLISLMAALPFYFLFILVSAPDSPMSVALSLFPLTSPLSILTRWSLTDIPLWQMALSWAILAFTALCSLYLVSRVLRVGMLRYGQRMSLRQILAAAVPPAGARRT